MMSSTLTTPKAQKKAGRPRKVEEEDDEDGGLRHRQRKSGGKMKKSTVGQGQTSDMANELAPARRRQAFPASGNRSATFR